MFGQLKMGILNQLRSTVSADKHRFVYGDIDIDFTYITDRIIGTESLPTVLIIIAMSYPAEGVEVWCILVVLTVSLPTGTTLMT